MTILRWIEVRDLYALLVSVLSTIVGLAALGGVVDHFAKSQFYKTERFERAELFLVRADDQSGSPAVQEIMNTIRNVPDVTVSDYLRDPRLQRHINNSLMQIRRAQNTIESQRNRPR